MEAILTSIAGRVYLAQRGTSAQRATYAKLTDCEALALGPPPTVRLAAALDSPEPFPTLADERSLVEKVMPAWMGIEYRPLSEAHRKKHGSEKGAVVVTNVFADSAAAKAGLQTGDIILGPPDAPFTEPHAVREWTMSSEIGRPAPLAVLRDVQRVGVTLRPAPFPVKMPELPGPPPVGAGAPPLKVEMFRGGEKVVDAKRKLLFFWATWCVPCKAALPEALAFARERDIGFLAITDEAPEALEAFYANSGQPLADIVAIDPLRLTFREYGVSGTPTFVLVDEHQVVRHYQAGYRADVGLKVDGWKWNAAVRATSLSPPR
jgi:thiol-disulfide isomerase/thioredoxin